jgi:hypothetical protein
MPESVDKEPADDADSTEPPRPAPITEQADEPAYSTNYQRACDQPESSEEDDLYQQWRMAKATEELVRLTEWQLWATITEIGLIIFTVNLAAIGVCVAFRANNINRLALIADQRAWLAPERIEINRLTSASQRMGEVAVAASRGARWEPR